MKLIIELIDLDFDTCPYEIPEEMFSKGWGEIEKILNDYLKAGIMPRVGERIHPDVDFPIPARIESISYCSHKIMVSCDFL